jgi:hypothetical protein
MSKTFTRAGISTCAKGRTRFRFTNAVNRETVLVKAGHTHIQFWELSAPMTREEAVGFLKDQGVSEHTARNTVPKTHSDSQVKPQHTGPEDTPQFQRMLKEIHSQFPSHTHQQVLEIAQYQAQCNLRAFGKLEPNF